MKQQSKIILGIAIVIALAVAGYMYFGIQPTENQPTETTLTQDYNGKTLTVHQGDRFVVALGDMQWSLSFDPADVVSRVKNLAMIRGAQGVYTADKVGTTVLTAEGRPVCAEGQMCAQYIVQFKATVVVQ